MAALCQGAGRIGGGPAEGGVAVRAEAAVQGAVGGGHGGVAGAAEFVDEAPLERAVGPPGGLAEVPDIDPQVLVPGPVPLPVQPQEPLPLGHRHRPGAHPQHVGHPQPALPPAQGAQDHFRTVSARSTAAWGEVMAPPSAPMTPPPPGGSGQVMCSRHIFSPHA